MKLKFKKPKSQLDEMQELQLKKTESFGFHFVMIGLALAMTIQGLMGKPPEQMVGELLVFEAGCIYILINYLRAGIWDRFLIPSLKAHIITSVLTGTFLFIFSCGTLFAYANNASVEIDMKPFVLQIAVVSLITAVICFIFSLVLEKLYKHRRAKLDQE